MLKMLESPDTVLALEVVGDVDGGDIEGIVTPGLQRLHDTYSAIRCVFLFGDAYVEPEQCPCHRSYRSMLGGGELATWDRLALVTPVDQLSSAMLTIPVMMPMRFEFFRPPQVREAIDWAAASLQSGRSGNAPRATRQERGARRRPL
jgi:hypothetical protein